MDFSEKWDLLDSNPEAVFKLSPTAIMTPKKKYVISIFVFMFVMTTVFLLQNGYNINNHEYFCDCQPNSDGGKNVQPTKVQQNEEKPSPTIQSKSNLNCYQKPFQNLDLKPTTNFPNVTKFAYVWYATENNYLCSALVAMKHIQNLRKNYELKVDYVLIFSKEDFKAFDSNGQKLLEEWKNVGGIIKEFKPLGHHLSDRYYKRCYQKFHAMLLTEYQRVIIMDSDGLTQQNLDHLFYLPFPQGIKLAAPQGYWFDNDGFQMNPNDHCIGSDVSQRPPYYAVITSILLLVEPNEELYKTVEEYFGKWMMNGKGGKKTRQYFDMDIINQRLACNGEMMVLPKHYGTLNSEYLINQKLSQRYSLCKEFEQVQYMHFSGLGKPWSHSLANYEKKYEESARPLIRTWFELAHDTCPWIVK